MQQDDIAKLRTSSGQKNSGTMIAEAQLLDNNDDKIVVLLKSSHGDRGLLMQIDKSLVNGIILRPSAP